MSFFYLVLILDFSIYFISFLRLYGALGMGTIKLNDVAAKLGLDLIFLTINSHIFIFSICNLFVVFIYLFSVWLPRKLNKVSKPICMYLWSLVLQK
jgi:hypothetical protein